MKQTLAKFIELEQNGLMLLDSPTGFGKTYNVLQVIKNYLHGDLAQNIDRIFFITNLKTNLPINDLEAILSKDEREKCFVAKAYEESLVSNWSYAQDLPKAVLDSDEYKKLKNDIEALNELKKDEANKLKAYKALRNKIATNSEPNFRDFLRKIYFVGKSMQEKKAFIKENIWFQLLYPICNIEKYKVIFMTTKRYFAPFNLFYRNSFYIYDDSLLDNSITFIDEFDSSKKDILSQIIDNSLKLNIDIIQLFTDINYTLNNLNFPDLLSKTTEYNKEKVKSGEWKTAQQIIRENRKLFKQTYKELNLNLLLKSNNFNTQKAFLFNDGNYITVFDDKSKKHLYLYPDKQARFLNIDATLGKMELQTVSYMINRINYCLGFFAKGMQFIAQNYLHFKNSINKDKYDNLYTLEESLSTIMSIFNINNENKEYLKNLLNYLDDNNSSNADEKIRKGFQFTEIEDSNYHDLKSIIHQFNFRITPENLLIKIAQRSKVIGVSATATLPTVIGNFDLKYLKDTLKDLFFEITDENNKRIADAFTNTQKLYDNPEINIKARIIDDVTGLSDKEKAINLLKSTFNDEILVRYLEILDKGTYKEYYFLIYCKLAFVFKKLSKNKVKSAIAFLNRLPKPKDEFLDSEFLEEMLKKIDNTINIFFIKSDNFDIKMDEIKNKLALGESCFIITTYQTIGSGKNIQYDICDFDKERVIINDSKNLQKDFEAIYLETPRNLVQHLSIESDNNYKVLAKFLFEQQSLCLAGKLSLRYYKQNIINGFRKIFFHDIYAPLNNRNTDLNCYTAQLVIQAIGRICRCKNKNKNIFIFSDKEILRRLKRIDYILDIRLLNREFLELYRTELNIQNTELIQELSKQNFDTSIHINTQAKILRSSLERIKEWVQLRDFVLKNPTIAKKDLPDKYAEYYFIFDAPTSGYSYKFGAKRRIIDINLDIQQEDMLEVSDFACDLPIILNIPYIEKMFKDKQYATKWGKLDCIMCPATFNQTYKGALGEVIGKKIIEIETGFDLSEVDDYTKYEYFDYMIKSKNIYFDFKHWEEIYIKNSTKVKKISDKLKKLNGAKAVIVNIIKRGEHKASVNIDGNILQIPYLIDERYNDISQEMIDKILDFID